MTTNIQTESESWLEYLTDPMATKDVAVTTVEPDVQPLDYHADEWDYANSLAEAIELSRRLDALQQPPVHPFPIPYIPATDIAAFDPRIIPMDLQVDPSQGISPAETILSEPSPCDWTTSPWDFTFVFPPPDSVCSSSSASSSCHDGGSSDGESFCEPPIPLSQRRMAHTRASRYATAHLPSRIAMGSRQPPPPPSRLMKRRLTASEAGEICYEDLSCSDSGSDDDESEYNSDSSASRDSGEEERVFPIAATPSRSFTIGKRPASAQASLGTARAKAPTRQLVEQKTKSLSAKKKRLNNGEAQRWPRECGVAISGKGKAGKYTMKGLRAPYIGEMCRMMCSTLSELRRHRKSQWHAGPDSDCKVECELCGHELANRQDNLDRHTGGISCRKRQKLGKEPLDRYARASGKSKRARRK